MNNKLYLKCLLTFAILLCARINAWAIDSGTANIPATDNNVVLHWNRVLQETIRTTGQHPATIFPVRSFAIMHAAMFDAVNSIDGFYTPYLTEVHSSRHASKEAAAGQLATGSRARGLYAISSCYAVCDYLRQSIRAERAACFDE